MAVTNHKTGAGCIRSCEDAEGIDRRTYPRPTRLIPLVEFLVGIFIPFLLKEIDPMVVNRLLSGLFFVPIAINTKSKSEDLAMKSIQREINGKKIEIYLVDKDLNAQIRRLMATKDDELIDSYLMLIYQQQLRDRANTRRHQSLEVSIEAGHQFVDEADSIEDLLIKQEEKNERRRQLYEAIKTLSADQMWLVKQVYVLNRSQRDIAKELGVGEPAISNRMKRILEKLKKYWQ